MGSGTRKIGTADSIFARNLSLARRACLMTLRDLAAELADTDTPLITSGLSKIEGGSRTATVGEAHNICQVLNVGLDAMTKRELKAQVTFD